MINWVPFLSYVFVTTFTPGPNNLMSTAVGVQYGYQRALAFIGGIVIGFFTIMLACSLFIERVYRYFPNIEMPLKILGAAYIFWLAYKVFTSASAADVEQTRRFSLKEGLLMQYANPKVIIYGITVTSSFIVPYVNNVFLLIAFSLFLAGVAFLSTSSWALAGSLFRRYLAHKRTRKIFNAVMALLLVYCALAILGVL